MNPAEMARIHGAAFTQSRPWTEAEFASFLNDPQVRVFVQDNGFALWRLASGEAELLTIAVAPDVQRQGVGRLLLQNSLDALHTVVSEAFLEVAADNTAAFRLYTAFGFADVGVRPRYYARHEGLTVDARVMRLDLRAHATRKAPKSNAHGPKSG